MLPARLLALDPLFPPVEVASAEMAIPPEVEIGAEEDDGVVASG